MKPPNPWTRRTGPTGATCGAEWIHVSGARVEHCGHPTALRPYTGTTRRGTTVLHPLNGRAFSHLKDCQAKTLAVQEREERP